MGDIAQLIGWGVAFVVFLGAAVVYLRGAKDAGTIKTLEKNNEALTERVEILEASELVSKAREEALSVRLAAAEEEAELLRQQRPSGEAIENLHIALIMHDTKPGSLAAKP